MNDEEAFQRSGGVYPLACGNHLEKLANGITAEQTGVIRAPIRTEKERLPCVV